MADVSFDFAVGEGDLALGENAALGARSTRKSLLPCVLLSMCRALPELWQEQTMPSAVVFTRPADCT